MESSKNCCKKNWSNYGEQQELQQEELIKLWRAARIAARRIDKTVESSKNCSKKNWSNYGEQQELQQEELIKLWRAARIAARRIDQTMDMESLLIQLEAF